MRPRNYAKAFESTLYLLKLVPEGRKTRKMREIAVLEEPETLNIEILEYCPDRVVEEDP